MRKTILAAMFSVAAIFVLLVPPIGDLGLFEETVKATLMLEDEKQRAMGLTEIAQAIRR